VYLYLRIEGRESGGPGREFEHLTVALPRHAAALAAQR